jgi:ubiquinone/menaquinone biosynthesis C-methylase UbiE
MFFRVHAISSITSSFFLRASSFSSRLLVQGDIQLLPFQNNVFDEVICSNVLHYVGLAGLKKLLRVTKSDGQLLLAFRKTQSFHKRACIYLYFGEYSHR